MKRLILCAAAALMLAACGTVPTGTVDDKAALTLRTADAVVTAADQLLLAKQISKADAQNVSVAAHAALQAVALARSMQSSGDPTGAGAKLDAAMAVLVALQTYEATKGKP